MLVDSGGRAPRGPAYGVASSAGPGAARISALPTSCLRQLFERSARKRAERVLPHAPGPSSASAVGAAGANHPVSRSARGPAAAGVRELLRVDAGLASCIGPMANRLGMRERWRLDRGEWHVPRGTSPGVRRSPYGASAERHGSSSASAVGAGGANHPASRSARSPDCHWRARDAPGRCRPSALQGPIFSHVAHRGAKAIPSMDGVFHVEHRGPFIARRCARRSPAVPLFHVEHRPVSRPRATPRLQCGARSW